jgi:putative thioredoxin
VPVVVDFWAPWCGPCRTLGPVLEKVAAEAKGRWVLAKINTDENQALAQSFGIQGIPAVKAFRDGKVVAEFVGAAPEPQVRAFVAGIVPDEASMRAGEAARAVAAGDSKRAEKLYKDALEQDPHQPDALIFYAKAAIARREIDAARSLVGRLRPADRVARNAEVAQLELAVDAPSLDEARAAVNRDASDPAARHALGLALAAAGDHAEALEIFLGLVKRNRTWGEDAGRKSMLLVFDAAGSRSPLSDEYRRRLSMELYK